MKKLKHTSGPIRVVDEFSGREFEISPASLPRHPGDIDRRRLEACHGLNGLLSVIKNVRSFIKILRTKVNDEDALIRFILTYAEMEEAKLNAIIQKAEAIK